MTMLFYIPVILILSYVVLTSLIFNQIPSSISNTHYMWKEKGFNYLFTLVMWATGIPILIYWIGIAPKCYQFLPFLSIVAMCFVGAAYAFKETLTKEVHYVAASLWACAALTYFIVTKEYGAIMCGATIATIGLIADRFRHFTFWAEAACVLTMIVGLSPVIVQL